MFSRTRLHLYTVALITFFCLLGAGAHMTRAQDADDMDAAADDPVKLFNQAQAAQARKEFERALALYDAALKLRPEYAEAEYQKGAVLMSLQRWPEAEQSFRHAAQIRSEWALPQTALGLLFIQQKRDKEAEPFLRRALELDPDDEQAMVTYALLWLRAGDKETALTWLKRATTDENATSDTWAMRGSLERASGDREKAAVSLKRALQLDPNNTLAHAERAELRATDGDYANAIADFQFLLQHASAQSAEAKQYQQRIKTLQALATRQASGNSDTNTQAALAPETVAAANSDDPKIARPALVAILQAEPKNAGAHARLCSLDRLSDPPGALEHCRLALEIEPTNADYATAYAAALVQAHRFADAVTLLRKVLAVAPDNYTAHANLATALDELKQYDEALVEYRWLNHAKPELAVLYYLIGRDLDLTGDLAQALANYETFLQRADPNINKDEIARVNLRLPALRSEIARGVKRRKKG